MSREAICAMNISSGFNCYQCIGVLCWVSHAHYANLELREMIKASKVLLQVVELRLLFKQSEKHAFD